MNTVIVLLELLLCAVIGGAVFFAVCYLPDFILERREMKIKLRKQRDAMVSDLISRLLYGKANLHGQSLDARKNMIRVSFDFGQATDRTEDGDKNTEQNEDRFSE
jgi:hypothetical protein